MKKTFKELGHNMRDIIIIGTLHNMLPDYENELVQVLDQLGPDQILVELVQDELENGELPQHPPEMVFAYQWAQDKDIQANGFDILSDNLINTEITPQRLNELADEVIETFAGIHWKRANQKEIIKLHDYFIEEALDRKKLKKRQVGMLKNIKKQMIKAGKVLIISGAGHLNFLESSFPKAEFPFRQLQEEKTS